MTSTASKLIGIEAAIAAVLMLTPAALAMGKGSGKPPKDDPPPPADPAIVYQIEQSDIERSIAIVNADGSNEIVFESTAAVSYQAPSWSHDGNAIFLHTSCPDGRGIYRASFDRNLLDAPPSVACPDLELVASFSGGPCCGLMQPMQSPDGAMVAYSADGPANQSQVVGNDDIFIVVEELSGRWSEPVNATDSLDFAERFPSWSPDGDYLAVGTTFEDDSVEKGFQRDVEIMKLDPFSLTVVPIWSLTEAFPSSPLVAANSIVNVMWSNSSDPNRIAIQGRSAPDASFDIWVLTFNFDVNGNVVNPILENLTNSPGFSQGRPSWSPDDSELLYLGQGESPCGGKKTNFSNTELVIIDSTVLQPPGGCEGTVILRTKSVKKNIDHPKWWRNHVPAD